MIDGLIKLMNSDDEISGPVNLGNTREIIILELASMIVELSRSKSKIVYKPLPEDDPHQRQPLVELAKKQLDWEPKTSLEVGLKKTLDYFKEIA